MKDAERWVQVIGFFRQIEPLEAVVLLASLAIGVCGFALFVVWRVVVRGRE